MLGQVSQFGPILYNFRLRLGRGRSECGSLDPSQPEGGERDGSDGRRQLRHRRRARALIATPALGDAGWGITQTRSQNIGPMDRASGKADKTIWEAFICTSIVLDRRVWQLAKAF